MAYLMSGLLVACAGLAYYIYTKRNDWSVPYDTMTDERQARIRTLQGR